ncbi:hypothetical protein INT47_007105 [Mucor saturninus]|uniref:Uncharacterized protein n=1 Tax=Mucor saturninus TaxID=64648 RepID=A0A8H7UZD3_9FUNG|nr:hypothetical protein INT47_007105 [Mucor saturninus]
MDRNIIDDDCDGCHVCLSLRDIIDIGLKPAIQNLANITASSLVDGESFESYEIDYIFIIEDMFGKARYTPLHNVYITILQRLVNSSIELKEKDTTAFILQETINQLMEPVAYMKSYMYNSFTTGIFHQASSATYGLSLQKGNSGSFSVYGHNQRSERITVTDEESTIVILKKGQLIPSTGLSCKLIVNLPSDTFEVELVRVTYSENSPKEAIYPKQTIRYSSHLETFVFPNHIFRPTHLCLEITPANYNSSLEFSLRMLSYEEEYKTGFSSTRTVVLDEPLTLVHA